MVFQRMGAMSKFLPAILVAAFLSNCDVRAQNLDQIGATALSAVTTNLNGTGIFVAQPEAGLDTNNPPMIWEVNSAAAGLPVNRFTYISSGGSSSAYPNSLGSESGHADAVAGIFYGLPDGVATNVARVDNFEADFFYTNYVANAALTGIGDSIVNRSFTFNVLSVSDQQQVDSQYDDYSVQNETLFVSAANNFGNATNVCAPGTSYNCISVGAFAGGTFQNSLGPTMDNGRCKPDLTAPADETSYSTPQVAGAAALLMQAALRGDGGADTNSAADIRTIKSLLLNGAVKPTDWTNSNSSPLDARYGAGVLNVLNSYEQLAGGKHGFIATATVALNGAHPPTGATSAIPVLSGWDFSTNTSSLLSDRVNHYYFNVTNGLAGANFIAAATLVWNRQKNQSSINNLNLFLYDCANSNLVNCSTSAVDNVEHLYIPQLAPGRYDLQVWKAGGIGIVSAAEPYALAWEFVSPNPAIAISGTNIALTWQVFPAGFTIESASDLASPNWSTNNLPASVIMNGQNCLLLNATNNAQFFRLRTPDF
jgi:hypothetical protein